MTALEYQQHLAKQGKPGGKYSAQRTSLDGQTFASKREATRYAVLALEQKAGLISDLVTQPAFALNVTNPVTGLTTTIGKYVADFVYWRPARGKPDARQVVEDSKGHPTPLYKRSKAHFKAQYGADILET